MAFLLVNMALIVGELEAHGYTVSSNLVDAVKLLLQERCRLYIVGIRKDLSETPYKFPILISNEACPTFGIKMETNFPNSS
jgi:site-specific DNA-cytosine methylase